MAYLIDPETGGCTVVHLPDTGGPALLASVYKLLGCDTIEAVYPAAGVACYIDERARIRSDPPRGEFVLLSDEGRWCAPILGRGLLVGYNAEGDETDCPLKPSEVMRRVRYRH